jgi:hypothetical protein
MKWTTFLSVFTLDLQSSLLSSARKPFKQWATLFNRNTCPNDLCLLSGLKPPPRSLCGSQFLSPSWQLFSYGNL